MDPQSGSSKPREPEEQVLPPSEQLLKRIDGLEVSHAYLKEEMAKLLDSHEAEAEATAEAEAEAETKAEAAAGAAAGTGTLNSQPRPFNRKSSELRSYSPRRAQYESSQRSHRVASSSLPQRSHSVSPQRNRLTRVRKDNYDVRQRTGQTLPQKTRHGSPLQREWGSSQSTRTLPKESANAFPDHFTDRDYINILQSIRNGRSSMERHQPILGPRISMERHQPILGPRISWAIKKLELHGSQRNENGS